MLQFFSALLIILDFRILIILITQNFRSVKIFCLKNKSSNLLYCNYFYHIEVWVNANNNQKFLRHRRCKEVFYITNSPRETGARLNGLCMLFTSTWLLWMTYVPTFIIALLQIVRDTRQTNVSLIRIIFNMQIGLDQWVTVNYVLRKSNEEIK